MTEDTPRESVYITRPRKIPVYLNVYDMAPDLNKKLSWVGLGVFHSGIEVCGKGVYAEGIH